MSATFGKRYRFVSVSFGTGKLYDYLCDDTSVNEGDRVAVGASDRYEIAVVFRVFYKRMDEMPRAQDEYKTVIRKIDN